LDVRAKKSDGTFPLKLAVNHRGQTALIPLEISLRRNQWDAKMQRVIEHPAKQELQRIISNVQSKAVTCLLSAKADGLLRGMVIGEIRDYVRKRIDPEYNEDDTVFFADWYQRVMDRHTKPRTHEIYLMTLQWMRRFDDGFARLRFEDITKDWLQRFFLFMQDSSPSINARNIHLRNIRAVFNDAIDNDITTAYPFRKLKIRPAATVKRNIKVDDLRRLFTMECKPYQQKYVDAFKLSFLLCGINVGDLCLLMPDNVVDGRIEYIRQKTGRLYSIRIEPETEALFQQYRGRERLLSFAEGCKRHPYRAFANRMNKELSEVSGVTSYWARHSWATIAASLDIPDDVISLALGHSARNATTAIYIERDRRKIDEANRRVIDWVLYGKK
jgi:integrase